MASGNALEPSWMSQIVVSHLPVDLQPQVNEIKSYCSSIDKTNAKIFSMMDEIDKKIKGFREQDFLVTDTEMIDLKMSKLDLDCEMEIAENFRQKAEETLQSLRENTNSYMRREGLMQGLSIALGAFDAVLSPRTPATGYELVPSGPPWQFEVVRNVVTSGERILQQITPILRLFSELQARCEEVKSQVNIRTREIEELNIKVKKRVDGKIDLLKPAT